VSETQTTSANHEPGVYEIRVQGLLEDRWADWIQGMTFERDGDGTTTLTGPLPDQAALHGVLNVIRDLGLPIISVCCARRGRDPG
jgi:hypothetical protein